MGIFEKSDYVSVANLSFRIYTDDEIKKISVLEITNPETFNTLGHISPNGLYDLRMGPVGTDNDLCTTCRLSSRHCCGHCGHIELPLPVYNPVLYDPLRSVVSNFCFYCYRFMASKEKALQLPYQMKLLKLGFVAEALELDNFVSQVIACAKEMEAEEVVVDSDKKVRKSRKSEALPASVHHILPVKLENYFKNTILNGTPQSMTSHVNDAKNVILRKFFYDVGSPTKCLFCNSRLMKLALQNSRFLKKNIAMRKQSEGQDEDCDILDSQAFLTPKQIQTALRKCWEKDKDVLTSLYPILCTVDIPYPTDIFFINSLLVIPPKFRPYDRKHGNMIVENEGTTILKNVLKFSRYLVPLLSVLNGSLSEIPDALKAFYKQLRGNTIEEKCQNMWHEIQCNVNNIYDSNLNHTSREKPKGLRQIIEKKEGLLRSNLMGKRVNYSARSVAAPDPNLAIDEVGVPMDFAIKLSFPVSVTDWNVEEMRRIVMNGPEKYPGALMVEDEEGKKVLLGKMDQTQRTALAKKLLTPVESHIQKVNQQKIVYRQLKNGDYVLMNRQPTLHRPSIQAHRVRVIAKDRVLRMPYANCKAYNADFDGDELNMHFPQSEFARSEAKHLITTHNQYLTPKDGSPLAGLIQDSVVSSVKITMRGNFFNREDYYQLVYASLPDVSGRIVCLPPCIMKPEPLWSGKQVISTLLHNVIPSHKAKPSFNFKTSVKVDIWQKEEARPWRGGGLAEKKRETLTESEFVMLNGELLCGVIDKSAIGSTSYGLIHTCYDLYGGAVAYKLLTAINRLSVYYLQWVGHTITCKDFVTPIHVSKTRREALQNLIEEVPSKVVGKLSISENEFQDYFESAHMSNNSVKMAAIDGAYTSSLGPTTSNVTSDNEKQLLRPSLDNHMKMMVDTGAKGSKVNMNQMASLFGSVAVDGKRMPLSITGKSLPSFKPYDSNPCAGGYIPNRFMTGINPKSYFFLCVVGRDSLQHTAVKTADSGYVQRCLIKHLEGIRVNYDMTVRNSDGVVLQFSYGEDGLDVSKVPFISNLPAMDVLVTNYSKLIDKRFISAAEAVGESSKVQSYLRKMERIQRKKSADKIRESGFLRFCKKMRNVVVDVDGYCGQEVRRSNASLHLLRLWNDLSKEEKEKYNKKVKRCLDPVDSVFSGASNLGVVSEALDNLIDKYYSECYSRRPLAEQTLSREEVKRTVHMKALLSKADPGEAVGALCAQALGEPLTQMTLNTFHFAGKDELNVTLGVPRMIEILRTGSPDISTPIMEVPFHPHVSREQAERLRLSLTEVPLSKVLGSLQVVSRLAVAGKKDLQRVIKIQFNFLPRKQYKHLYAVNSSDVLKYVEKYFILKLVKEIYKSFKEQKMHVLVKKDEKEVNKASSNVEELENKDQETYEKFEEEKADNEGLNDSSEEDEEEEEEEDEEDGARKDKAQDYADVEDDYEDEEKKEEDKKSEDDDEASVNYDQSYSQSRKSKGMIDAVEAGRRMFDLQAICPSVKNYKFDQEKELWCEVELALPVADGAYDIVSIVRDTSEDSYVRRVKGIRRVLVVEKDNALVLRTEGVNILKMYAYEHLLNVNRLYTNNIHQVAEMYGIEAAQRSIIREIRAVQSAYDIKVNFRHLSLLADYFTCEGKYKSCSRGAISTCTSPIQKMSFETSAVFLRSALMFSELDTMASPSSDIVVGQPPKVGTNAMHVRYPCNGLRA